MKTDVAIGFEPFWLSALVYFALPAREPGRKLAFISRVNMCPMLNYDVQFPSTHANDVFLLMHHFLSEWTSQQNEAVA